MNPEHQASLPHPASESECGGLPKSVEGASLPSQDAKADGRTEVSIHAPHPSLFLHGHSSDDMAFFDPPKMLAEPDYDSDYDFEECARERELLMDDLASDNDDFARSDEEGWYYSDED